MKRIYLLTIVTLCFIALITLSKKVQSADGDEYIYLPIVTKPKSPYWSKTYSEQGLRDFAMTQDGGHLVLASDTSYGFTLAKLDANGEPVWEKTGSTYAIQPITLTETDDGNIIIAGATNDDILWAAKFSSTGTLIWQKNYSYNQRDSDAFALTPTSNGGVAMAGHTDSGSDIDYWILNLDKDGAIIWQKTFGGDATDLASLIKTTPDNGFIVSGYTYSFGPLSDTWVIKLDSGGNLIWQKMLQRELSWDLINDMAVAPDGSSYFIGKKNDSSGSGTNKWWGFKLDAAGNLAWSKTYGITDSTGSSGYHIEILDNDNIYVSGSSYKDNPHSLIMNLDSSGNARWHQVYDHTVSVRGVDNQFITVTGSVGGNLLLAKAGLNNNSSGLGCSSTTQPPITIEDITKRIQTTSASMNSSTISINETSFFVTDSTFPSSQTLVCGG